MRKILNILTVVLFAAGVGVLLFPVVSNLIVEKDQSMIVKDYSSAVKSRQQIENEEEIAKAKKYNEGLGKLVIDDPFATTEASEEDKKKEYFNLLNVEGIMGYIQIPKIDLRLPIYHGTSEEVLQKGIGHLYGSSFPVGGEGTNAVLTGHRGLPKATLFTHLDKIKEGDRFYVNILEETLAYEVVMVKVIEPYELEDLQIKPGKDLVTLFTCTPYGINSHRIVIQAEHVEMDEGSAAKEVEQEMLSVKQDRYVILAVILIVVIILIALSIYIYKKAKKRKASRMNRKNRRKRRRRL